MYLGRVTIGLSPSQVHFFFKSDTSNTLPITGVNYPLPFVCYWYLDDFIAIKEVIMASICCHYTWKMKRKFIMYLLPSTSILEGGVDGASSQKGFQEKSKNLQMYIPT